MTKNTIYLDYAAATPLDKRVFKAMQPYFSANFYNPSAPYQPAREVRVAVETARTSTAHILGAKSAEIIFTAGATESINLAFKGLLELDDHCVVSSIEHQAVLETAKNFKHSIAKTDNSGRVILASIKNAITAKTKLVSIGLVNSEIGIIQDIKAISSVIKKIRSERLKQNNQTPLWFHTDATQAAGLFDLNVARLGTDLLTVGGNKIYGPKQTGILFVSSKIALHPLLHGGGQERNLRSGTENVPGIIGFCEAFRIASKQRQTESERLTILKRSFLSSLTEALADTVVIGDQKHSSPHIVMLAWPGVDAERVLFRLESNDVLVGTGSACGANKHTQSPVLAALGLTKDIINGSLRFSFGRETNEKDLKRAVKIIVEAIMQERA